jgi:transcriptional regulator with XRE-family HTH domain
MNDKTVHEGRNVKRIREILGIKQDTLANELGLSQQAISALEQKEALDKDMLEKIANVLKISPQAIKEFSEESIINNISCNFSDHAANNVNYNFSPIDKILEMMEEIKKLHSDLLKAKDEQIELLKKMIEKK